MAVARKYFDASFLPGDMAIRDPDSALLAWGKIIELTANLVGFEPAFFLVSLLGAAVLSGGVYRIATTSGQASPRGGMIASLLALTVTFGNFGYALSVPSHANFYPTPRFVAVALATLAVSFVLNGSYVVGVLIASLATTINTLDGIVPVGLALIALLVTRSDSTVSSQQRRLGAFAALIGSSTLTVLAALHLSIGSRWNLLPGSTAIVALGMLFVVALSAVILRPRLRRGSQGRALLLAILVHLLLGVLLAQQRVEARTGGFLETLTRFELILRQVRAFPSMLLLSSTSVAQALLFVALCLLAIGLIGIRTGRSPSGSGVSTATPDTECGREILGSLTVVAMLFVGVGSLVMEATELPLLVTLWPLRPAWIVVLTSIVLLSSRIDERLSDRVGLLPLLVVALIMINPPVGSRLAWSWLLLLVAAIEPLLADLRQASQQRARRRPADSSEVVPAGRGSYPNNLQSPTAAVTASRTAVGLMTSLLFVVLLVRIPPPEIRIQESMDRLARSESVTTVDVVQMAQIATSVTPLDSRILVPPDPHWGAFRIMSERGVAFEWKQFSSSQPATWYEQLRWMCDPDYRISSGETFDVRGPDIFDCHARLSFDEIMAIAEQFRATHVVIDAALTVSLETLGITDSGHLALVAVPTAKS